MKPQMKQMPYRIMLTLPNLSSSGSKGMPYVTKNYITIYHSTVPGMVMGPAMYEIF